MNASRNRNSAGCQFRLGLLVVGLAVLIRLAHPTAAFASETDNGPAITVLVFNYREAPVGTLMKAKREAGRILDQIGVHVTWRDCLTVDEPCRQGPGRVFILEIMAGPVQNKFADRVAGFAFPVEERAAPRSDVPGEHASPTQPIPMKPPPLARQTMSADEA